MSLNPPSLASGGSPSAHFTQRMEGHRQIIALGAGRMPHMCYIPLDDAFETRLSDKTLARSSTLFFFCSLAASL